ncbi:hypothetical protein BSN85_18345 [Bradyrhizobium brasilense]|nr:hypothetical protein BSN85_18345 [Bradyrhizobium brasilense]
MSADAASALFQRVRHPGKAGIGADFILLAAGRTDRRDLRRRYFCGAIARRVYLPSITPRDRRRP